MNVLEKHQIPLRKNVTCPEAQSCHPQGSVPQIFKCKAIDVTSLQGMYKLSHSWVIVPTTVQTNNTKCVLKGILIEVSGLKVLETCLFQSTPYMPDSTIINQPLILW